MEFISTATATAAAAQASAEIPIKIYNSNEALKKNRISVKLITSARTLTHSTEKNMNDTKYSSGKIGTEYEEKKVKNNVTETKQVIERASERVSKQM